jgi:hypothetical protein
MITIAIQPLHNTIKYWVFCCIWITGYSNITAVDHYYSGYYCVMIFHLEIYEYSLPEYYIHGES